MLERARQKLEKELMGFERELRVELPREIQKALEMGDLRENAEYKSALERQHFVKARIGQLQVQLRTLSMVDISALPKDRVALGSTISLYEPESEKTIRYDLVVSEEADFAKGLVSISSPIGRALIGHRVGDEVTIRIPAGTRFYEIVELITVHDKETE
ncbi:MAG: transcription elongation factor GreA [Acidobacteria bacterium]|nr:transcription elongation factor GreA [Acidobacteriota bacterium]